MSQIPAYVGPVLLLSAVIFCAFRLGDRKPLWRWGALMACSAVMLMKVGGIPLAGYVRAASGDLSITTLILLVGLLWRHLSGKDMLSDKDRAAALAFIALGGLLLYPMTLGMTPFDPYRLGFASRPMCLVLLALAVWGGIVRRGAAVIIPVAVLAFNLQVLESSNLWDYLIDPWVTAYAWGWVLVQPGAATQAALRRIWRSRATREQEDAGQ